MRTGATGHDRKIIHIIILCAQIHCVSVCVLIYVVNGSDRD